MTPLVFLAEAARRGKPSDAELLERLMSALQEFRESMFALTDCDDDDEDLHETLHWALDAREEVEHLAEWLGLNWETFAVRAEDSGLMPELFKPIPCVVAGVETTVSRADAIRVTEHTGTWSDDDTPYTAIWLGFRWV